MGIRWTELDIFLIQIFSIVSFVGLIWAFSCVYDYNPKVSFLSPIVVTYLALYRLDELGMAHFRKFVMGQDLTKMNKVIWFCYLLFSTCLWLKTLKIELNQSETPSLYFCWKNTIVIGSSNHVRLVEKPCREGLKFLLTASCNDNRWNLQKLCILFYASSISFKVNGSTQICFARWIMGTCERREIQCRIRLKCKQWSSCYSWNFPAPGKQTKLNLIGRIRHVTHLRANSVHLVMMQCSKYSLIFRNVVVLSVTKGSSLGCMNSVY